jgi:hypothetical protein
MSIRDDNALTTERARHRADPRRDVGAAAELAAGVQLGGDHLDAGRPVLGSLSVGDAAPVVDTSTEPSGAG